MIVIGADTHKGSHALAAVEAGTGRMRGRREIKAEEPGHLAAVRWARGLDEERVWALEDCRAVSRRLEQALLAAGEQVLRVAPHRMGQSRKGERRPAKSDQIDALAIARAVVGDGIEKFPAAHLDEQAMEIRLLLDHRGDLVADRTRTVNRLRWHLLQLCPELKRSVKPGAFNQARILDRVDRRLRKLPAGARVRVARNQVAHIRRLNRHIEQLRRELVELVRAHRPQLLAETGCGPLVAATLIGRTAGAQRFRSDASFALQSGTAPIPCSSGKHTQHRLNRGGDRQLNHALHIVAITRANHDPATKAYLERKQAEGKTNKGALRCLKRHLARRFHYLLSLPAESAHPIDATAQPSTPTHRDRVIGTSSAPRPHSCPASREKPATSEHHLT
jgi:transposase